MGLSREPYQPLASLETPFPRQSQPAHAVERALEIALPPEQADYCLDPVLAIGDKRGDDRLL